MAQVWTNGDDGPRGEGFQRSGPQNQDFESRLVALERRQARVLALLEQLAAERKAKQDGPRGK
jgi:hypothetical protein